MAASINPLTAKSILVNADFLESLMAVDPKAMCLNRSLNQRFPSENPAPTNSDIVFPSKVPDHQVLLEQFVAFVPHNLHIIRSTGRTVRI